MSTPGSAPAAGKPAQGKVTAAWILAIVALFCIPIITGPIAIYLGYSADKEGNPGGRTVMMVAIVTTIIGIIGGIAYFASR